MRHWAVNVCGWRQGDGGEEEGEVGTALEENDYTAAKKWFGVISFRSVLGIVRLVRGSNTVHLFTAERP